MKRKLVIVTIIPILAVLGVLAWCFSGSKEPVYHGKPLRHWLDEYNGGKTLDQTEPISDAIRAMGTNTLPFLMAHIRHSDSPSKKTIWKLIGKIPFFSLPYYGDSPYRETSVLALHALGAQATPLLPELLEFAGNPSTTYWGTLALLAIGTNAIPALEMACRSTNALVRARAALMIAMMRTMPAPYFSSGWNKAQPNGRPMFNISWAMTSEISHGLIEMLESPEVSIRRASADAIRLYTQPGTSDAKWAIRALVPLLHDLDLSVRRSAQEALKKLKPDAATPEGTK